MSHLESFRGAPFAVLAIDSAGLIVDANLHAALFCEKHLSGSNIYDLLSSEQASNIALLFTTTKQSTSFALRVDEHIYVCDAWRLGSLGSDKRVIIELKRTDREERKLDYRDLLSHAVDQSWEAVCITDAVLDEPGPRMVYFNQAHLDLFGYRAEEVAGKTPRIFQGALTDKKVLERLKNNLRAGENFHGETVNYRKNGEAFWLEWKISPVRAGDKITHFIAFQRDITELKTAQLRLKEFYSVLVHELRAPLTAIKGSCSLLETFNLVGDAEAAEMIAIASESTDRLIRLVNELLDLESIETGSIELKVKPVSVADLLVQATAGLKNYDNTGKVTVRTRALEADVIVDKDRMIQVLINLISNALKYSPDGGTVEVLAERKDNGAIRFSVQDSGPGIARADQQRLFTRFHQLVSPDGTYRQGTGLGLAIAKALVEQHSGVIGVNSEIGTGSTFWFELPEAGKTYVHGDKKSGSILLVEDDAQLTTLIRYYLSREGYTINAVSTLAAARQAMAELHHDACILDLKLPDGNGLTLLEEIRGAAEQMPVLMTSAARNLIEARDSLTAPASLGSPVYVDWLNKPFTLQDLGQALERLFNLKDSQVFVCQDSAGLWKRLPGLLGSDQIEMIDCSVAAAVDFKKASQSRYVALKFDGSPRSQAKIIDLTRDPINPTTIIVCCDKQMPDGALDCLSGLVSQQISSSQLSQKQFIEKLCHGLESKGIGR